MHSERSYVLKFQVIDATGEDEEYPVTELNVHRGNSKGWQSPKNPVLPQEITMRIINGPAHLSQIQILSHESKIATKIDILVSESADASFRPLGYIPLDDNSRNNYEARELKSVSAKSDRVEFVRFRCRGSHPNPLNPYNQIGIIAINLLGWYEESQVKREAPLNPQPVPNSSQLTQNRIDKQNQANARTRNVDIEAEQQQQLQYHHYQQQQQQQQQQQSLNQHHPSRNPNPIADDIPNDITQKLLDIRKKKEEAVANESFEEAKQLKEIQIVLEKSINRILSLSESKKECVAQEDYVAAKKIKDEMTFLINEVRSMSPQSILQMQANQSSQAPVYSQERTSTSPPRLQDVERSPNKLQLNNSAQMQHQQQHQQQQQLNVRGRMGNTNVDEEHESKPLQSSPAQDAFPAANTNRRILSDTKDSPFSRTRLEMEEKKTQKVEVGYWNDVPGLSPELIEELNSLAPESLPNETLEEAQPIVNAFDEYVAKSIFSKEVRLRIAALRKIHHVLSNPKTTAGIDQDDLINAVMTSLKLSLTDNAPQVILTGIRIAELASRSKLLDTESDNFLSFINSLVDVLGNVDVKVRNTATALIVEIDGETDKKHFGHDDPFIQAIIRPMRAANRSTLWIPLHSRLVVLFQLMKKRSANTISKGSVSDIVTWMSQSNTFSHPNQQVRDVTRELVLFFSTIVGKDHIRKQLEEANLNSRIFEEYERALRRLPDPTVDRHGKAQQASKEDGRKSSISSATAQSQTLNAAMRFQQQQKFDRLDEDEEQRQQIERYNEGHEEDYQDEEDENDPHRCQFCNIRDESKFSSPESLYLHYFRECFMLTTCPQCKQVIEVSRLNEHLIEECDMKANHRQCPRCGEAIAAVYFDQHLKRNSCLQIKPIDEANRCPLCHNDIPPGDSGWFSHLKICPRNSRTKAAP